MPPRGNIHRGQHRGQRDDDLERRMEAMRFVAETYDKYLGDDALHLQFVLLVVMIILCIVLYTALVVFFAGALYLVELAGAVAEHSTKNAVAFASVGSYFLLVLLALCIVMTGPYGFILALFWMEKPSEAGLAVQQIPYLWHVSILFYLYKIFNYLRNRRAVIIDRFYGVAMIWLRL